MADRSLNPKFDEEFIFHIPDKTAASDITIDLVFIEKSSLHHHPVVLGVLTLSKHTDWFPVRKFWALLEEIPNIRHKDRFLFEGNVDEWLIVFSPTDFCLFNTSIANVLSARNTVEHYYSVLLIHLRIYNWYWENKHEFFLHSPLLGATIGHAYFERMCCCCWFIYYCTCKFRWPNSFIISQTMIVV